MIDKELTFSLHAIIGIDEQTTAWMAAARTPETRALIRRWSWIESIGLMAMVLGVALLVIAPFGSIAVAVWADVTDTGRSALHWWIWGITLGLLAVGGVAALVASGRRERACFADGHACEGVVDRAIEHPGSGDDRTWYDLRISAALANGVTLRRRLHLDGEQWERRVGRPVQFRHNTFDPEALDDVLLIGWPTPNGGGS